MSDNRIIEKVRKLLALANDNGASEGERDNAMRMAYAFLAKHNLTEDDLEIKEIRELITMIGFSQPWARSIAMSLAKLCFCNYYIVRGTKFKHNFVGKASNAVTAQLMTDYVVRSVQREAGKLMRAGNFSNTWHGSFCKGAAAEIALKSVAMRKSQEQDNSTAPGTGLVIVALYKSEAEANATFIKEQMGINLTTSKGRSQTYTRDGFNAGAAFGKTVNLSRQVGGNETQLRLR